MTTVPASVDHQPHREIAPSPPRPKSWGVRLPRPAQAWLSSPEFSSPAPAWKTTSKNGRLCIGASGARLKEAIQIQGIQKEDAVLLLHVSPQLSPGLESVQVAPSASVTFFWDSVSNALCHCEYRSGVNSPGGLITLACENALRSASARSYSCSGWPGPAFSRSVWSILPRFNIEALGAGASRDDYLETATPVHWLHMDDNRRVRATWTSRIPGEHHHGLVVQV